MPIKCPNCSKEYPDQAIFCGTCGIKLDEPSQLSEENQQAKTIPIGNSDVKRQSDNKKFTTLAVVTGLTTLLSIIFASTLPFTPQTNMSLAIPNWTSIITWITGFCFLIALSTIRIKDNQKMLSILILLTIFVLGSCFANCGIAMGKDGPLKHQPIETTNQQTTEEKAKANDDAAKAKANADAAKAKANADAAKAKAKAKADADAAQEKENSKPVSDNKTKEIHKTIALIIAQIISDKKIDSQKILLQSYEEKTWGSTALGCPKNGMMYAQVETDGYSLTVSNDGKTEKYHSDKSGNYINCTEIKESNLKSDFETGMGFLINQNYDKAIASFKKHIELNPDDINGYIKISEAYYESNQQNEAFKYINQALEINPSNQNAIRLKNSIQIKRLEIQINEDYKKIEYLAIGTQYFRQRNFQKAIENLEKHIKLNPDDIHGYMTIAVSFQELKNFEEAFKNFNLALNIDPNFIPAYIEKGLAYYEIEEYDEAIKTFYKIMELEPKNPVAIEFIGKIKNQQKESSKEYSDSDQSLAKYLTNIGATMYGAYWCPYCSNQKNLFGTDFIHINYVECDPKGTNPNPALCKAKNITGYPTWEINGEMHKGVHSIEELASLSGYKKQ